MRRDITVLWWGMGAAMAMVVACATMGTSGPWSSAALPAAVYDPDPKSIDADKTLDAELVNGTLMWTWAYKRDSWAAPGTLVDCDFDAAYGSSYGSTSNGIDNEGVMRANGKPTNAFSDPNTGEQIFRIKDGYGIVSGKYPIMAGRRVRAASDGTQFALEIFTMKNEQSEDVIVERVHFITSAGKKPETQPLRVRVYTKDDQLTQVGEEIKLNALDDYFQITWKENDTTNGYDPKQGKNSDTKVWYNKGAEHFATTVKSIILHKIIPPDRADGGGVGGKGGGVVEFFAGESRAHEATNLMARFERRFESDKDKVKVYTSAYSILKKKDKPK